LQAAQKKRRRTKRRLLIRRFRLELEPEPELRTVRISERCTRPLPAAIALRSAKTATVEIGIDVVAGIVAIPDVVHLPNHAELHVFADLEGIRGAKVKLDERLAAETVYLDFLAAQSLRSVGTGAVDCGASVTIDVLACQRRVRSAAGSLEGRRHLKA